MNWGLIVNYTDGSVLHLTHPTVLTSAKLFQLDETAEDDSDTEDELASRLCA